MNGDQARCGKVMRRGATLLAWTALFATGALHAESSNCAQARATVEEIKEQYARGQVDHAGVLSKAKTAIELCPALGEAWKYAFCSATALKDKKAGFYQGQAVFNGVTRLDCGEGGSGGAASPAPLPSYVRDKYALVIGIGRFQDPSIPTLQFTAKDAKDFAAVLVDPRFGRFDPSHVKVLTDEMATRENILNALNDIAVKAREDDLVLLYFSSHGSPRQDDSGLGGVGYIVTYDTSVKSLWLEALEYEDFSRKVAWIRARRKVAFLDTCFSGQAKPGAKALVLDTLGIDAATARQFLSGEGTYVITSSRSTERSFESDTLRNSYFTHYLIEALKSGSEPPTVREIFDRVSRDVPAAVLHEKGAAQHPQILPEDGNGDVRIGVAPRGGVGSSDSGAAGKP
jgi:hypothetical protein